MTSIYQQEIIDYVTVAAETCLMLEHANEHDKQQFLYQSLRLLPLLYLKTQMLQPHFPERYADNDIVHFVSEDDYNYIAASIQTLLAEDDAYLEVFLSDMKYSDTPITAFISENLADIYQELKDMAANYQTENETVMQDAITYSMAAFHQHWGQKLLNALKALHNIAETIEN